MTTPAIAYSPRLLRKFENSDGSISYTWPLIDYEWESIQGLRVPEVPMIGSHYAFDLLGSAPGLKESAEERIRFTLYSKCGPAEIDSEVDTLRSRMFLAGKGKGWISDKDGNMRWAYMRLTAMPTYSVVSLDNPISEKILAITANFRRESDWFAEDQIDVTETVTSTGATWVVNNPGNIPARRVIIKIKSNSAAGFTNPKITNNTLVKNMYGNEINYEFESTKDASSSDDVLKLDTTVPSVRYSDDDEVSFSDDFSEYVLPANTQKVLSFALAVGDNTIQLDSGGTVNCDVQILADAPYA